MADEKKDDNHLKIYARVRKIMPWEPSKQDIRYSGTQIETKGKVKKAYTFSKVFDPSADNAKVFKKVCEPMAKKVMEGFNAVVIAYGQTGSGKTHSLLGKPQRGVTGLLPMTLQFFLAQRPNCEVDISAIEAFGHHVNKIELYDLFGEHAVSTNWQEKSGHTAVHQSKIVHVYPKDDDDADQQIITAHSRSHFAPTGKNPESSRGHIAFIIRCIQRPSEVEKIESYFLIVDLAGSEGETAFTPAFKKQVDASTLMARRLEAGVINTGLSALQIIFNELKVKGRLSKMQGNGLRHILHPYINTRCALAVLFCISPSYINMKATISTLKFAVQAGMVQCKPIKEKTRTNYPMLIKGLNETIAQLHKDIEGRDDKIETLEQQVEDLGSKIKTGQRHVRVKTEIPADISAMMFDNSDSDTEGTVDEEHIAKDVKEEQVEKVFKARLGKEASSLRGDHLALQNVLGVEKEEMFRRATVLYMDESEKAKSSEDYDDIDEKVEDRTQEELMALHMDNTDMTKPELIERLEILESVFETEKTLQESYLFSQKVMIDHLARENEGLLQFFRVKFGCLDLDKKKKKGKKGRKSVKNGGAHATRPRASRKGPIALPK